MTKHVKDAGCEHRRELVKLIRQAAWYHEIWQIWDDLMYFTAASIAQPLLFSHLRANECRRRKAFYDKRTQNLFLLMSAEISLAYEQEGFTDILGGIYAELGLDSRWGRSFSPAGVCEHVAGTQFANMQQPERRDKYISVNDLCCGSGAMLIAFADICEQKNVDYRRDVLFTAWDVDAVAARMCFISMSQLGMAGRVVIADASDENKLDDWFTPAYFKGDFPSRQPAEQATA